VRRLSAGLTTAVLAVAVAPALPLEPAAGAMTATLTITGRPEPVLGHELVTLTGRLTPVRAHRVVTLQRSEGGRWKVLGSARTNTSGTYNLRTRAPLTGHEVVRTVLVAAGGALVLSRSLTIAPVKATISVSDPGWVVTGGVLKTSGAFAPARPGRRVSLQRKAGSHWVTLATTTLSARSRYAMNARLPVPPGSASLRVLAAPSGGAPAAVSAVQVVTVADAAPPLLGPFSAVYLGLAPGSTPGSYGQPSGAPALDFTDDGRVTSAVPVEGPDSGTATTRPSVRTGVYSAHDGVVDIGWDTDGTTVTLRPNAAGQLPYNGMLYGIVDPLQGASLSGTYTRSPRGSGATIVFKGSGRFDDDGVTADTSLGTTDNPSGAGSYAIRGNTVYLVYDSGPLESMAIYVLPQYLGGKARIVLGGAGFRKLS
jgi:hypothetical protein